MSSLNGIIFNLSSARYILFKSIISNSFLFEGASFSILSKTFLPYIYIPGQIVFDLFFSLNNSFVTFPSSVNSADVATTELEQGTENINISSDIKLLTICFLNTSTTSPALKKLSPNITMNLLCI